MASSESSGDREKESTRSRGSDSPAADVEIEYVTEEPEIYEPNFIFFKRIFEAFKVQGAAHWEGAQLSRERAGMGKDRVREGVSLVLGSELERDKGLGFPRRLPSQLTDDVKKEKEKEPEKLDKLENSTAPKKKGFEEEHKDSDDDSSDDEQVRPASFWGGGGLGWVAEVQWAGGRGELLQRRMPLG